MRHLVTRIERPVRRGERRDDGSSDDDDEDDDDAFPPDDEDEDDDGERIDESESEAAPRATD